MASSRGDGAGDGGTQQQRRLELKLEKIWIVALGSRGDIQPYVAVGAALVKRGYRVTFLTNNSYARVAEDVFGMRGVALCEDFETSLKSNRELSKAMMEGDAMRCFAGIAETHRQNAPSVCNAFVEEIKASGPPDLVAAMPFAHYAAWYLSVHHSVPYFQLTTFPVVYNPDHALLNMPNLPFGLGYYLLHNVIMGVAYDGYKVYDDHLEAGVLKKVTKASLIEHYKRPRVPIAGLLSPEIGRILYSKQTSTMIRFVGTTVLESKQQQVAATKSEKFGGDSVLHLLEAFLQADPSRKPVYLGWGSMVTVSPEYMVVWCVRAVREAGQRAIVLGGNAVLSFETLERAVAARATTAADADDDDGRDLIEYARANILFVPACPHEWLFSRVRITVHHGGAGTTTAALRAGTPTIVTPVFGDQYDFSYAVRKLGVGIGFDKQLQQIGWQELGEAIRKVVDDEEMKKQAAELGTRLRSEDGANRTVDQMESFWEEFCLTGRYRQVFPANGNKEEKILLPSRVIYTAIVIGSLAVTATVIARRKHK